MAEFGLVRVTLTSNYAGRRALVLKITHMHACTHMHTEICS